MSWVDDLSFLVEQVKDVRVVERKDDIEAAFVFALFLPSLCLDSGVVYRGHSVADKGWQYLIVLKVVKDGIPLVGFVNERDAIRCMRICVRLLREGRVKWVEDRFG